MIQIDDHYRVNTDILNWILQEKHMSYPKDPDTKKVDKTKTPEAKWDNIGYYGNLNQLISALLDMELRESDANTLEELQVSLYHAEKHLKQNGTISDITEI